MMTILKTTDRQVRTPSQNRERLCPEIRRRAFDAVAYAAALEVLG
jgi:hypothetical protein